MASAPSPPEKASALSRHSIRATLSFRPHSHPLLESAAVTAPEGPHAPNAIRTAPLAAGLAVACVLGVVAGVATGAFLGWNGTGPIRGPSAAIVGGTCVLTPALAGYAALVLLSDGTPGRFSMAVLAGSVVRLLLSLLFAVVTLLVLKPEPKTFITAFLASGVLALTFETAWSMRAIRRVSGSVPAGPPRGALQAGAP